MELRHANLLFNDCYRLYKEYSQVVLNDNDVCKFIKASDLIYKKYHNEFAEELVLAVVNEIDRILKQKVVDNKRNGANEKR